MTTVLDYPSLTRALGGETQQLMVYGFADCKYDIIATALRTSSPFGEKISGNPVQRVFDHTMANTYLCESPETTSTLEGRKIHKIKFQDYVASRCKAALVNIIIENCKRNAEGLPLIPVLFAIGISTDSSGLYPPSIPDLITDKQHITLKELRRVYKLCTDLTLPEHVRAIAERTFKFVKVIISESPGKAVEGSEGSEPRSPSTTYSFESIKAPWESVPKETWQAALAEYKAKKKQPPPSGYKGTYFSKKENQQWRWRPQLLKAIAHLPVMCGARS
jgi:hypothetical protein